MRACTPGTVKLINKGVLKNIPLFNVIVTSEKVIDHIVSNFNTQFMSIYRYRGYLTSQINEKVSK